MNESNTSSAVSTTLNSTIVVTPMGTTGKLLLGATKLVNARQILLVRSQIFS